MKRLQLNILFSLNFYYQYVSCQIDVILNFSRSYLDDMNTDLFLSKIVH